MSNFKEKTKECFKVLIEFLKHPVQGMKALPDWPWNELLPLLLAFSAVCGAAQVIVAQKNFLSLFAGVIFFPIAVAILIGLFAGFFYYVFLFFFRRQLDYKRLYTIVTFASLPSLITTIATPILPPAQIVGVIATLALLVVGLTENFQLPRQKILKLMAGIFLVFLILWIYNTISYDKAAKRERLEASPQSMDILEKEFKTE